jgi:hypothetical protein
VQAGTWRTVRAWNVQRRASDFLYLQRVLRRRTTLRHAAARRANLDEQTDDFTAFLAVRTAVLAFSALLSARCDNITALDASGRAMHSWERAGVHSGS